MGIRGHTRKLMLAAAIAWWPQQADSDVQGAAVWDRETALRAAHSVDALPTRQALFDLTLAGSAIEAVDLLQATSVRSDWPIPAREAVLFEYVNGLRSLPSASVPVEVMNYLRAYTSRTLVAGEDHPRTAVALFNIRGAAAGVENAWLREEAALEGHALLAVRPASLVDAFVLESHPAVRGGYLDALRNSGPGEARQVARQATRRIRSEPGLTALAGHAALQAYDVASLEEVVAVGRGPSLASLLREAGHRLGPNDASRLLLTSLDRAPPANAALAIAQLTPALGANPTVQARLLERLGDAELGSAAALALARTASSESLETLESLTASDDPLAAARAAFVLKHYSRGLQP